MILDIICWGIIGISIFALAWVLWACLVMASRYDDITQEYWNEYWGKDDKGNEKEE